MQKKLFTVFILLLASQLVGCTNYLYQGAIKAEDSAGKQRQVVLYWSKTDPLIGDEKADMAHLLTECGALVVFENQPQGIIFRGNPDRDRLANTGAVTPNAENTLECGRILHAQRLTELGKGKVSLTIRCEPISNEFSVKPLTYIKAREAAYDFDVSESKSWSFLGSTPKAPAVPKCTE
jgi:hypothetical protein